MEIPLFEALMQYKKRNPLSLHVPGHKNGTVFLKQAEQVYKEILSIDVTELNGLDDLHQPREAIAKAQQFTANLYGVQTTNFLVNGSTVGNLAMILACCNEGDVVLVQRNSHKSIIHGLQLAGASPVFLTPKIDKDYQVPSYIEYNTIREAIRRYPRAKALILTNPTYYGLSIDLTEAIELAHNYQIPVLVDEAHGAHFIIGDQFPGSAIEAGADIIVQSAHKTLPAMTMGSFLHFNSDLVSKDKLHYYLSVLQSSSPSYPIMASLDLARAYLEVMKMENKQHDIIHAIKDVKLQLSSIAELEIVDSKDPLVRIDPLKITLRSKNGLTGYDLQHIFELENIYAELADPINLLFILPLDFSKKIVDKLSEIKSEFITSPQSIRKKQLVHKKNNQTSSIQPLEIPYSRLKAFETKVVTFNEAIGYYSAQSVIPYPPGIPLIMNGEKITVFLIEELKEIIKLGVNIQGDDNIHHEEIAIYWNRR